MVLPMCYYFSPAPHPKPVTEAPCSGAVPLVRYETTATVRCTSPGYISGEELME